MEPQVWEEGKTFPGSVTIDDKGPAKETAQNWRRSGTIWTDGSRLDSGAIGAACAWQMEEGWTGRRFHLGTNKEVFDAEIYAIYQAQHLRGERPVRKEVHGSLGLPAGHQEGTIRRTRTRPVVGQGGH